MNPNNPLSQLKDIYLPQEVSIWPLAWPWWLMLMSILTLCFVFYFLRKKNKWKKTTLIQLKAIDEQENLKCIQACNRLLKQVALQRFGPECAPLNGLAWLEFLDSKVKQPIFLPHLIEFAHGPDQSESALSKQTINAQNIKQATENWVRKHTC